MDFLPFAWLCLHLDQVYMSQDTMNEPYMKILGRLITSICCIRAHTDFKWSYLCVST